jgi:hypothetical protein
LPVTIFLISLCNCMSFVVDISTMGCGLPAMLDDGCCYSLFGFSDVPSTRVRSTSKFFVGTSPCGRILGSLDPDVGIFVFDFLTCSSKRFHLRLLS